MNKKIGFIVGDVGANQLAFDILANAKAYYATAKADVDIIAFVENPSVTIVNPSPIAIMPLLEMHDYDGVAIATSLATSSRLQNAIGPKKRFFYVHELEWLASPGFSYEAFASIIRHPSHTLIAPTQEYADLIGSAWNVPVLVFDLVNDFEGFIRYTITNG